MLFVGDVQTQNGQFSRYHFIIANKNMRATVKDSHSTKHSQMDTSVRMDATLLILLQSQNLFFFYHKHQNEVTAGPEKKLTNTWGCTTAKWSDVGI